MVDRSVTRPQAHGREQRGLDAVARQASGFGRYGRMFPKLAPARYGATLIDAQKLMEAIGGSMIKTGDFGAPIDESEPDDENPDIPAAYTYFGQFVDHDITFDTASDLDKENDPQAIEDFRTARLDLDSVYGRGPDDQPYLYNRDLTFKLGADKTPNYLVNKVKRFDLLRAPFDHDEMTSGDDTLCRRAIIGDPRNDENSLVLQIHVLWQRLHNRIMADLAKPAKVNGNDRPAITGWPAFNAAQRSVRWHYQWIVLHDFVKRIVGKTTFDAVFKDGMPELKFYQPDDAPFPFMPVEFSVAAYRFGHSMVRPSYTLSARIPHEIANRLDRLNIFAVDARCGAPTSLNGFRPLIPEWGLDWSFFLHNIDSTLPADTEKMAFSKFVRPQPSYRIDTLLVDPLHSLPDHQDQPVPRRSLANLNLLRGLALGLPSGQAVARSMGLPPLTDEDLWTLPGNLIRAGDGDKRRKVFEDHKALLSQNAPLWYYVLREAELTDPIDTDIEDGKKKKKVSLGGRHLGPVGGRIVAEVLIGLVMKDTQSYLAQTPVWKPTIPTKAGNAELLELSDIVRYVDS